MATATERRAARASARKTGKPAPAEASLDKEMNVANEKVVSEASGNIPTPKVKGATVTVACKIPQGIILQCYDMIDSFEPVFGGGSRPIKVAQPTGESVRINGNSRPVGSDPDAKRVIGGFALTYGVSKDFWDRWLAANSQLDMVKNGMIFAHEASSRSEDQAKDMRSARSGLEALNTEGKKSDGSYVDPRMPTKVRKFDPAVDATDIRGT